ncbi:copper chaperone PCu(A)C [Shewanella sp. WXL01]|uniref:Copper chaperone PCu(A)C n=1 Tax=Shewanella maritima TaxID=2520507 RepID=A0A411PFP4_9GAMM|nr:MULTISPECIES: copper chaperone PCu(A)C [Shewanella]NKF49479.1 copper chaperone PCu(A)C [Shewanella sp. WXL01]QBF82416.1 copper chaperone PCu(A)C [Shewanella maritima]
MEFKTLKKIFKHLFNSFALMCFALPTFANVMVKDGYVRAMPASVPNTAAYMTLMNHTSDALTLVGVTTSAAKTAELHTIIEQNGVVKMRQVEGFELASHASLTLQPSGDHIMLLGLAKPLVVDDTVSLTLHFSNGTEQAIELPVKKKASASDEHAHHHHH